MMAVTIAESPYRWMREELPYIIPGGTEYFEGSTPGQSKPDRLDFRTIHVAR
jgi:hypothetical protein